MVARFIKNNFKVIMRNFIFCPNCQSGNTKELTGTDYRTCQNCGRIDFEQKFNARQAGTVPYRFHEIIDVKSLDKRIYARGQYDQ